jgi:transposase InsO family protein
MKEGGWYAEAVLKKAKERYPLARPWVITDNDSRFIAKDFRELIVLLEMEHTVTSAGHPQSNGKLERFHRTFRTEHIGREAYICA